MTGPAHEFLAVTMAIACAQAAGATPVEHATIIGGAYLAARFPDIDQKPRSPFAHRTVTHWLETHILVAFAAWQLLAAAFTQTNGAIPTGLAATAAAGILIGLVQHTLADSTTPDGVELSGLVTIWRRHHRRSPNIRTLPFRIRFTATAPRTRGAYIAIPEQAALIIAAATLAAYLYLLHGA